MILRSPSSSFQVINIYLFPLLLVYIFYFINVILLNSPLDYSSLTIVLPMNSIIILLFVLLFSLNGRAAKPYCNLVKLMFFISDSVIFMCLLVL